MIDTDLEAKAPGGPEGGFRRYEGPLGVLVKALGSGGCLFCILYLAGAFAYFRVHFFPVQYNAIFMAVVLVLTFLVVPASKKAPRDRLPWYDVPPIFISLAGTIYIIVNAFELSWFGATTPAPFAVVLGLATLAVLVEAVRRSFGWAMVIIAVAFLLYAKFGYLLSGPLSVYYFSWSDLVGDVYLSVQGVFGSLTDVSSSIIIAFITFGSFFVAAGGGRLFLRLALGLTGTMRGGPAKAAVVGSALFGTISGSTGANVAVTGSITIPLMKRTGYKPYYAAAVEAIASSGGMIMPPVMGALAFVMAQMLGVPYSKIAITAAVPAILYFFSLYVQVDLQAAKQGLKGLSREQLPSVKAAIREGWEFGIPIAVLVAVMFVMKYPAVTSAIYSIAALISVSMFRKQNRINLRRFIDCLDDGLRTTLPIANIIALAGIILAVLVTTGLGPKLSAGLVTLFGSSKILLLVAAGIASYVMGMGITLIASYILVTILVGPALLTAGVPLIVSHFFIFYIVTSTFFTPPYCPVAYIAAAIAGANPFRVGFQAMRLGIVCFLVPLIIVYNPALLLIGEPWEVAEAVLAAAVGIFGLSAGIEGYLFTEASWLQRLLLLVGGVLMTVPGLATIVPGIGILGAAVLWQWVGFRRTKVLRATTEARSASPGGHGLGT